MCSHCLHVCWTLTASVFARTDLVEKCFIVLVKENHLWSEISGWLSKKIRSSCFSFYNLPRCQNTELIAGSIISLPGKFPGQRSQAGHSAWCLVAQSCLTLCDPMNCSPRQAPLFMGFSRQEYWSGLPCPPPGSNPGLPHRRQILWQLNYQGSPESDTTEYMTHRL